jgi:hypothetical protein
VSSTEDLEARHGQKMIEVKLRFWTNDIAEPGKVRPRHAWAAGVVRVERNDAHGITPGPPLPFHSLLDVGAMIEKALIAHGIVLRPGPKMVKYLEGGGAAQSGATKPSSTRSDIARRANASRTPQQRSEAAKKANVTRGVEARHSAAKKALETLKTRRSKIDPLR